VMKAFVVFLALGFAMVVVVSWAFEATPEGMKRTENVRRPKFSRLGAPGNLLSSLSLSRCSRLVWQKCDDNCHCCQPPVPRSYRS
jgi:hypothetical protein